jgi:hypothetical protein
MRDYRRQPVQPTRLKLQRGADGNLRSASSERDIADIWAEQRRIKLAEAIQQDQKKAAAKQEGWKRFFKKKPAQRAAKRAPEQTGASKEIVVNLGLPKIKKLKVPAALKRSLASVPKKRLYIGGGLLVFFVALTFLGPFFYGKKDGEDKKTAATTSVLNANSQAPEYETLLPEGETIQDLGGWKRVTPADKDPVFAFADTISGVPVLISQQPLPQSFKKNVDGEISKLAGQFGANEKVADDDQTVYIGTSAKGPQSAIMARKGLLVLIRSESKVENQAWLEYVLSLR